MMGTDRSTEFSVTYEGEALRRHTMPVRDLAPALLALGEAFDRANSLLNGDKATVSLEVKATVQGCFEIQLLLKQLIDNAGAFLSGDFVTSAVNLKEIMVGGPASAAGLFSLLKRLKGKKPKQVHAADAQPGAVVLEVDNLRLTVPAQVYKLYQDRTVRQRAEVVVRPVGREGIDRMVLREGSQTLETVNKDDIEAFVPDSEEDGNTTQNVIPRQRLKIVSTNFEKGKWRLHDGEKSRYYDIADKTFVEEVQQRVRSFRSGDILICQVVQTQYVDPEGNLTAKYTITDVLRQVSVPDQLSMDGHDIVRGITELNHDRGDSQN